jgi:hypothetical protein
VQYECGGRVPRRATSFARAVLACGVSFEGARALPMRHIQPHPRLAGPQTARKAQTPHPRGEEVRAPVPGPALPIPTSSRDACLHPHPKSYSDPGVHVRVRFAASVSCDARGRRARRGGGWIYTTTSRPTFLALDVHCVRARPVRMQ